MSVIVVERHTRVAHRADPKPPEGKSRGTVLAIFDDLRGHRCAAVQWDGGFVGVSRLKWLERV